MNSGQSTSRPDTWLAGVTPAKALGRGHPRATSHRDCMLGVHVVRTISHWEVWILRRGQPLCRAGSIGLTLATDALRHGQNLVDDLLNDTLKQLERSRNLPACVSVGRSLDRSSTAAGRVVT